MAINIEDHELVPTHEILSEEETEELLEQYDANKEDLPKIARKDPMAKQIDAEVGDVVKIERESPTAGETTYYRRVVEE